jgi:hypothetical protein
MCGQKTVSVNRRWAAIARNPLCKHESRVSIWVVFLARCLISVFGSGILVDLEFSFGNSNHKVVKNSMMSNPFPSTHLSQQRTIMSKVEGRSYLE